jgi:hypothetical protein
MAMPDSEMSGRSAERDGKPPKVGGVRWSAVIVAAVIAIALIVGAVYAVKAFTSRDDPAASAPTVPANPGPIIMTKDQLLVVAATSGHSIYWAGPRGLTTYEVTIVNRDIYVRYLPAGVAAGSSTPYLTVGTYEKADAYAGLVSAAAISGAKSERLAGGALVVVPAGKPTSAYFAFQGANLLMEVFDPVPGAALKLVTSGAVQPIK